MTLREDYWLTTAEAIYDSRIPRVRSERVVWRRPAPPRALRRRLLRGLALCAVLTSITMMGLMGLCHRQED